MPISLLYNILKQSGDLKSDISEGSLTDIHVKTEKVIKYISVDAIFMSEDMILKRLCLDFT